MIRQENGSHLSKRLQTLAEMVSEGVRVVDVGCDHGYLDIDLVQSGKIPGALAMDVRKGPLSAAAQHVQEAGLLDRIETRLSDGLEMFEAGEAECLVCAGMGGPLMQRILTAEPEKPKSFQEMILQPQSELREFRKFLRDFGYEIIEERIVWEEGKYYFPMKVVKGNPKCDASEKQELYDRFGKGLLLAKEPLLKEFLLEQKRIQKEILENLSAAVPANEERLAQRKMQVEEDLGAIEAALLLLEI